MRKQKKTIRVARGVRMGLEAVTQTFGILGIRESGKTYAGTKLAEEMVLAGGQIVVIDPVGKWWGLRLQKDGRGSGLEIPLLGGLRGDLPLDPRAGELVARTVVETGSSVILDVSTMTKGKRKEFVTNFCEALFHLRAQDPAATHVFLEEAHVFAPQQYTGQERMLGAVSDIVRLGRNHGLGVTLIDQRPQSVSKDVLNQTECLFAMRLVGKHERQAVRDWIRHAGVDLQEMADELPALKQGEAMLWSPSWLRVFQKVQILAKRTYDSSATPKVGKQSRTKKLKPLDVQKLAESMSQFVEEQKANDPKALKQEVQKLKAELKKSHVTVVQNVDEGKIQKLQQEVAVRDQRIRDYQAVIDHQRRVWGSVRGHLEVVVSKADEQALQVEQRLEELRQMKLPTVQKTKRPSKVRKPVMASPAVSGSSEAAPQKILDALAWWESIGVTQPSRRQVGFVAGYTMNGYFNNTVSKLRTQDLIQYPGKGLLQLTEGGQQQAQFPEAAPTTEDLQQRVRAQLKEVYLKILDTCLDRYPEEISREDLAAAAGYTVNGYFNNTVSRMRTLGLIDYPKQGWVRASDLLFLD